jgi:hypothetical protein
MIATSKEKHFVCNQWDPLAPKIKATLCISTHNFVTSQPTSQIWKLKTH